MQAYTNLSERAVLSLTIFEYYTFLEELVILQREAEEKEK